MSLTQTCRAPTPASHLFLCQPKAEQFHCSQRRLAMEKLTSSYNLSVFEKVSLAYFKETPW